MIVKGIRRLGSWVKRKLMIINIEKQSVQGLLINKEGQAAHS